MRRCSSSPTSFPTGYSAIDWAGVQGGETVAVFGAGPVGVMAMKSAWLRGAKRVIGIDIEDYRLEVARRTANAETLNFDKVNVVEALREMTDGRGPDVCVDAVGMEAESAPSPTSCSTCGTRRWVHDQGAARLHLRGASWRSGDARSVSMGCLTTISRSAKSSTRVSACRWARRRCKTTSTSSSGTCKEREIRLDDIISHRLPLSQAPHGYEIFRDKKDDCMKVVLSP